jgi:nitroimidazol reductase NimA-like FMN-containing flavoprotein (pyridoxamine 5'-phosphate oxidase superfamily)
MSAEKKSTGGRASIVPDWQDGAPGLAAGNIVKLSPAECFELLEPGGVGRIGFSAADGIMMLPVNFAMSDKTIVFRTAPDTLLALYTNGSVSFEVDRLDAGRREAWSVLVHGHSRRVTDEREVTQIEERTRLEPWAGGARDVYVRITPGTISGRRIQQW